MDLIMKNSNRFRWLMFGAYLMWSIWGMEGKVNALGERPVREYMDLGFLQAAA